MVKKLLNLATETLAGIRSLPAIHSLAQESTDARVSERAMAFEEYRSTARELELCAKLEVQRKTIDGLRTKLAAAEAEIARLRAAKQDNEKPEPLTYGMVTNRSGNGKSLQSVITRSDGLTARSSWWDIDDGSAESEASDRMRDLEKKEEEDDGKEDFDPDKCTCFISPPCGYCTSGNVREQ